MKKFEEPCKFYRVERDTESSGEDRVTAERVRISCPEIVQEKTQTPITEKV